MEKVIQALETIKEIRKDKNICGVYIDTKYIDNVLITLEDTLKIMKDEQ